MGRQISEETVTDDKSQVLWTIGGQEQGMPEYQELRKPEVL